ncbi:MAG: hypothetical protein C5B58_00525 [Acidobacteria bacterium]|nr:MAG: hypothetical protein C5B58_00525 [Acidobacteriota bacterium]
MMRDSSLFQLHKGSHACVFYRNDDSLLQVLTPYVADGLRRGERCFCAQKPEIAKRLVSELCFLGFDVAQQVQRGALEIHSTNDAYFGTGKFDPQGMMEMLETSIERAARDGFPAFRTAGEMSWAVEKPEDAGRLIRYESLVEASFPGKPAIALCQYSVANFRPQLLESLIAAHGACLPAPATTSLYSRLDLRLGDCIAQIVADRYATNPHYDFVVEREGAVLGWGSAINFEHANSESRRLAQSATSSGAPHNQPPPGFSSQKR